MKRPLTSACKHSGIRLQNLSFERDQSLFDLTDLPVYSHNKGPIFLYPLTDSAVST